MCVFLWPGSLIAALAKRGTPISIGIADPGYLKWARKVFTDRRIHRPPDCVSIGHRHICCPVALSPPFALSDSDKLDALRQLDQFREWRSLDDTRYCLVCGKIINGRQIQLLGDTRGNGPLQPSCPTERCNSIPMDWVLPTDENLAVAETMASEKERNVAPPGRPIPA
jgi:hypothetical protein